MEDCWIEKLRSGDYLNECDLILLSHKVISLLSEENTVKLIQSPVVIIDYLGNTFNQALEFLSCQELESAHTVILGNDLGRRNDSLLIIQLLLVLQSKHLHKLTILKSASSSFTLFDKAWFYNTCVKKYNSSNEWRLLVETLEYLVLESVIDEKVICINPKAVKLPAKGSIINWGNEDWAIVISLISAIQNSYYLKSKFTDRELNSYDFQVKLKIQLSSSDTIHKVAKLIEYAPFVFQKLRSLDSIHCKEYLQSFDHSHIFHTITSLQFSNLLGINTSSNSGSLFYTTYDSKYLIKTISSTEFALLRKLLKNYYEYLSSDSGSLMTRYYGLYKIVHDDEQKIYFVVMNNLFHENEAVQEMYDLKGSTSNRHVDQQSGTHISYKDLDFVKRVGKIKLGTERCQEFFSQVKKDCQFLCSHDILDYSLLVGISDSKLHETTAESKYRNVSYDGSITYFIGIIDMLTQFNSKKKVEYFFKFFVYKDEMSCVPPNLYAERFLNFIESVLE